MSQRAPLSRRVGCGGATSERTLRDVRASENHKAADECEVRVVDRERVEATREQLISIAETDQLAEWFRTLGDPTRARILYALLEAGELCVCDLAASIDVAESTVSHALRWLRSAEFVRSRRGGRMIHYRLADSHVRLLLDLGREHLRHHQRARSS